MPTPSADADATPVPLRATVHRVRTLAVAALLGLIALGLAWELWLAPTGNRSLALKVLPLALPLVGLLKQRLYTYRWVSLLVWPYFIEGVVRAMSDPGPSAWLAAVEVLLCVLLFVACVVHVRLRLGPRSGSSSSSSEHEGLR